MHTDVELCIENNLTEIIPSSFTELLTVIFVASKFATIVLAKVFCQLFLQPFLLPQGVIVHNYIYSGRPYSVAVGEPTQVHKYPDDSFRADRYPTSNGQINPSSNGPPSFNSKSSEKAYAPGEEETIKDDHIFFQSTMETLSGYNSRPTSALVLGGPLFAMPDDEDLFESLPMDSIIHDQSSLQPTDLPSNNSSLADSEETIGVRLVPTGNSACRNNCASRADNNLKPTNPTPTASQIDLRKHSNSADEKLTPIPESEGDTDNTNDTTPAGNITSSYPSDSDADNIELPIEEQNRHAYGTSVPVFS
jgi:hypothetical protein